ncbi:MAG: PASTA domain-containing protein [Elusimicrobiales bacterium]|nr:PASTA domain-containing protein [Elusimicrobiales bacterium]
MSEKKQDDIPLNYKYIIRIISVILIVILFSYFSFNWIIDSVIHSRKEVVVPFIIGKSPSAALEELSKLNLAMQVIGKEFDSSVPVGTILRQKPQPGIKVREGRIIKVVISQGGEAVFVPNVVGIPLRNAELYIRQRQLILGQVTERYSNRFPKGVVISQEPDSDVQVEKNTYVNLLVSAGSPPQGVLLMPDFRQKNISDFYRWVEDNKGIKYKIERDLNSIFPRDIIIDQKPDVDSVISDNEQVIITVSDNSNQDNKNIFIISHQVPKTGSSKNVRIVAFTTSGEKEIFNGIKEPGSRIELSVPKESVKKIRIYVNGTLVEEKRVE